MGTLSQLLRWKKEIILKNGDKPILENGKPKTVWIRIIGDYDLQESFKIARRKSAEFRAALRDVDSNEYKETVLPLQTTSREDCEEVIRAARATNWTNMAISAVVKPDLATIEEIAVDPDAATLEEQERVDAENALLDAKYEEEISEFIKTKEAELEVELKQLDDDQIRLLAQVEVSVIIPLTVFLNEVQDQKIWRAVYEDKDFKIRGFSDVDDYRQTPEIIKTQLINAYSELEGFSGEDIKN